MGTYWRPVPCHRCRPSTAATTGSHARTESSRSTQHTGHRLASGTECALESCRLSVNSGLRGYINAVLHLSETWSRSSTGKQSSSAYRDAVRRSIKTSAKPQAPNRINLCPKHSHGIPRREGAVGLISIPASHCLGALDLCVYKSRMGYSKCANRGHG